MSSETELKETKLEITTPSVKNGKILTPQWDYVMMFTDIDPPLHNGAPVHENDSKFKKFAALKEKRKYLLATLKKPSVGLTASSKRLGNRLFVLLTASEDRFKSEAERIEMKIKMKPEYGGGYDSFEKRKQSFYESAQPVMGEKVATSFFRRMQRQSLVLSILEARSEDGGCEFVMSKLLTTNVISKFYGLHDEEERADLMKTWSFRPFRYQDINRIRNYLGEELAFYFAWLGFKTERLLYAALLGIIVFVIYEVGLWTDNDPLAVWPLCVYSIYLAVWAALFQNYWARYESTLAFRWGVHDLEDVESIRPEYAGDESREGLYYNGEWIEFNTEETNTISNALTEIITGENRNKNEEEGATGPLAVKLKIQRQPYYPAVHRNAKLSAAIPILGSILALVIIATFSVLTFRLFLQRSLGSINNDLSTIGSIIGSICNAIVIIILNQFYQRLALWLTQWENYRTATQFNNNLTFKMFLFQFVNSYTSLYYMAFFKNGTRLWWSDDSYIWDACNQGNPNPNIIGNGCAEEVEVQIATLMLVAMTVGNFKQIVLPWVLGKLKFFLLNRKRKSDPNFVEEKALLQYEKESTLVDWPGVFDEYSEMAVQYGYITLFAAVFPLAPALGWINCMIQIRSDSFKILQSYNRPHNRTASGIGTWRMIFEILGVVAIVTNCALICFSYETLLTAIQNNIGASQGSDLAWKASFITLGIMIIIEHALLITKYLIDVLIPDVPGAIRKLKAKSEFIKTETFRQLERPSVASNWELRKIVDSNGKEETLSTDDF